MFFAISDDFDPEKIIGCGQCFRPCRLPDGRFRFFSGRRALTLRPVAGGVDADCSPEAWREVWRPYFDLDRNYAAIRAAAPAGYLREAAACGAGLRVLRQDPWETLVSFLISQRKSIPAIRTAIARLCALCGGEFPDAEAIFRAEDGALAACGLGYRLPYLRDAAAKVLSGALDLEAARTLDDDALRQALMTVNGVGVKVANCVCLFAYGRVDCAPVDVWIARMIEREFGGENPLCRPNGGIYQQYLFYAALQEKKRLL